MDYQVELSLQFRDDEANIKELVGFFSPVASPKIERGRETASKSLDAAIAIGLGIVGAWAAERYILDPLADRAEEWLKAVLATWQRSKTKRRFNITVRFKDSVDRLEVHISDTADVDVLKRTWDYIEQARQTFLIAKKQGITLDQVRLLPDGSQDMLVVGYTNGRPLYTVDLKTHSLHSIKQELWESEDAVEAEIWVLGVLIRRLDYLKWLGDIGRTVPSDELDKETRDVQVVKLKLRG